MSFKFLPSLSEILRLSSDEVKNEMRQQEILEPDPIDKEIVFTFASDKIIRLNNPFNLMVYSDIAQPVCVGDAEVPLLRTVPVEKGHWLYQCSTFSQPKHVPLSPKFACTISVYIFTDFGKQVPFHDGCTAVTLDFRRSKSLHTY